MHYVCKENNLSRLFGVHRKIRPPAHCLAALRIAMLFNIILAVKTLSTAILIKIYKTKYLSNDVFGPQLILFRI